MKAQDAIRQASVWAKLVGRDEMPNKPNARKRWLANETTRLSRRFREMDLLVAFGQQADAANQLYPRVFD